MTYEQNGLNGLLKTWQIYSQHTDTTLTNTVATSVRTAHCHWREISKVRVK